MRRNTKFNANARLLYHWILTNLFAIDKRIKFKARLKSNIFVLFYFIYSDDWRNTLVLSLDNSNFLSAPKNRERSRNLSNEFENAQRHVWFRVIRSFQLRERFHQRSHWSNLDLSHTALTFWFYPHSHPAVSGWPFAIVGCEPAKFYFRELNF